MNKFLVLYMAPSEEMKAWMQKPAEERAADEAEMQANWRTWMQAHAGIAGATAGVGKTQKVRADGVTDSTNDVMLYSIVEAESPEEASAMFEGHPHLGIPNAWIEVSMINPLQGMA